MKLMKKEELIKELPSFKWTYKLNKFIANVKATSAKKSDDDSSDKISKDDWIEFVSIKIFETFKIRYKRDVKQGSHSINAYQSLMIYNEYSHIWEEYSKYGNYFASIISKTKQVDVNSESLAQSLMGLLGVKNVFNTIPPAYSGTRYQLFLNGIYDLAKDKFMPSESIEELEDNGEMISVEKMGFVSKHMHRIMFNERPKAPIIESGGKRWDFRKWLLKVNNNNKERAEWLLFMIGVCSLPNVNVGANFMLIGPSGSGKSTIGSIIKTIYMGDPHSEIGQIESADSQNIVNSSFEAKTLGEEFPFRGSLDEETNFVHLSEMNKTNLNEQACVLYDKFCDNEMEARKMKSESFSLSPTPTLYMEGTGFPKMETVKNGVERRTFPFKIEPTEDLVDYRVSGMSPDRVFSSDKVIQWVVYHAFKKIREIIPEEEYASIKVNMQYFDVPDFIKVWKNEFISGGDEISEFYSHILRPAMENRVIKKGYKRTYMLNEEMLYRLYKSFEESRDVPIKFIKGRKSFTENIMAQLERSGFNVAPVKDYHLEETDEQLALDLVFLNSVLDLEPDLTPEEYEDGSFANKKKMDWFSIEYEG